MFKTKTETQDLQDQYWKSMTGMDCDKQKDWKSHGKQKIKHTGSCTVNNKTWLSLKVPPTHRPYPLPTHRLLTNDPRAAPPAAPTQRPSTPDPVF